MIDLKGFQDEEVTKTDKVLFLLKTLEPNKRTATYISAKLDLSYVYVNRLLNKWWLQEKLQKRKGLGGNTVYYRIRDDATALEVKKEIKEGVDKASKELMAQKEDN